MLRTIFLEQRSKIRASNKSNAVDSRNARSVAKGVLVSRALYVHLKSLFPQWSAEMEAIMSPQFYMTKYGVDACGRRDASDGKEEEDEEAEDEDEHMSPEKLTKDARSQGVSTYASKAHQMHNTLSWRRAIM